MTTTNVLRGVVMKHVKLYIVQNIAVSGFK